MGRAGRMIQQLNALKVNRLETPGMYADGGGLYLQVTPGGRSWIFKFTQAGKGREMGLGSLAVVSLQDARNQVVAARRLLQDGYDPIQVRRAQRLQAKLESTRALTFSDCAKKYVSTHKAGWKNAKHIQQWENTLATYAAPILGKIPVHQIDTALVLKVLETVWTAKPETASRLRGRIEVILDWAKVQSFRDGENPARWRGHLDKLLPKRSKVKTVQHHPALPYDQVPEFMKALRAMPGTASKGIEFAVLTAGRTSEIMGAKLEEVDMNRKLWSIPSHRMKSGKEHRIPLSPRALSLLNEVERTADKIYLFPGRRPKQPLSNMAFLMALDRMGFSNVTMHGFRSTFRDWAAEQTSYPNEVVEMALAHTIESKVEAAYRRGDLYEKRRALMDDWATYCLSQPKATEVIEQRQLHFRGQ